MKKTIAHIYALGDQAITIEWASSISEEVNNQVMHSFHFLQIHPIEGVTDMIPAYSSLTLIYNPTIIRKQAMGGSPFEWLKKKLTEEPVFINRVLVEKNAENLQSILNPLPPELNQV